MDNNGNGIEVQGPHGFKIRAHGVLVYITLIMILALGVVGGIVYFSHLSNKEGQGALQKGQSHILEAQGKILDAQRETTYVLTLSAEEREKLKLQMPDTLRARTGR